MTPATLTKPRSAVDAISAEIDHLASGKPAIGDDGQAVSVKEFAVPPAAGLLLERAAEAVAPRVSIEIGCASGLSTLHIARGRRTAGTLAPGSCHVIDPHQRYSANIGLNAIRRAGLESAVTFHHETSHLALPRLLGDGVRAQFAFIDGMHLLDFLIMELSFTDLMLDVGGVIAVHDMWMPALQHAVCYWVANRAYEVVAVHGGELRGEPCESIKRGCGAVDSAPQFFKQRIMPFVDWSVLLVRKLEDDRRVWNHFQPYIEAALVGQ